MAEPFKNMFNPDTIGVLADRLAEAGPLDVDAFMADALDGLEELELKDRVRHISSVLRTHLDPDYPKALEHIISALPPPLSECEGVTEGFHNWPFCQFVEDHGVDDPDHSLPALYELTRRFSAEFAIRPFLVEYPDRTLAVLGDWAEDEDPHVRRLCSEGSRPRLPWGLRLQFLVEDPSPTLPILEKLRDDPEEYVRRSVANHLNDIAKDNPDVAVDVCRRWMADASKERVKLVKHALRGLTKQGHPGALELLGFGPPQLKVISYEAPDSAVIGGSVELQLELESTASKPQELVIDYALHFPGAKGKTNRKVFKWRTATLEPDTPLTCRKKHSFAQVSTRRTLPGTYRFEVFINGNSFGEVAVEVEEG
jgi:3-methyladenine DNA glycosylase AlkC